MKKLSAILALTAGLSVSAFAADYTGYLVDKSCSGMKGMWTNAACVQKCVKGGDQIVFVTEDGKVYTVDQAKVSGHLDTLAGKKVVVSGTIKGDGIDVMSVKGM
jgi:hypothetical protein